MSCSPSVHAGVRVAKRWNGSPSLGENSVNNYDDNGRAGIQRDRQTNELPAYYRVRRTAVRPFPALPTESTRAATAESSATSLSLQVRGYYVLVAFVMIGAITIRSEGRLLQLQRGRYSLAPHSVVFGATFNRVRPFRNPVPSSSPALFLIRANEGRRCV